MNRRCLFSLLMVLLSFLFFSCSFVDSPNSAGIDGKTGTVSISIDSATAQYIAAAASSHYSARIAAEDLKGLYIDVELKGGYTASQRIPVKAGATATFEEVPILVSIYAEANIYSIDDKDEILLFTGTSNKIKTTVGTNPISLSLKQTTEYKVHHFKQNLEDDEYTEAEVQRQAGLAKTQTNAKPRPYEGFTAKTIEQKKINPDGTTEINIYYDRNVHKVTYTDGTDDTDISVPEVKTYRYGAKVTVDYTHGERKGWDFKGWNDGTTMFEYAEFGIPPTFVMDDKDVVFTAMWTESSYKLLFVLNDAEWADDYKAPIGYTRGTELVLPDAKALIKPSFEFEGWFLSEDDGKTLTGNALTKITEDMMGDLVLYAKWKADEIEYLVRHFKQNIEDDGYTEVEEDSQKLSGKATELTEAGPLVYTGFTARDIEQKELTPGEGIIIDVYYDRNVHKVIYDDGADDAEITVPEVKSYRYGETVTIDFTHDKREGFVFFGWKDGTNCYEYKENGPEQTFVMGDEDITLVADWKDFFITLITDQDIIVQVETIYNYNGTGTIPVKLEEGVKFIAEEGYSSYSWTFDNDINNEKYYNFIFTSNSGSGVGNMLTVNTNYPALFIEDGIYDVALEAEKDGKHYSFSAQIKILK